MTNQTMLPYVVIAMTVACLLAIYWLAFCLFRHRLEHTNRTTAVWDYVVAWTLFLPLVLLAIVIHLWRERRQARQGGQS